MEIVPTLALLTFAAIIAFAFWSKYRTERKLEDDDAKPSTLARCKPDPELTPNRKVTDPYGVTQ